MNTYAFINQQRNEKFEKSIISAVTVKYFGGNS